MAAQTTFMNTISLPDFTDLVEREFALTQKALTPAAKQLFITDNIPLNTGAQRLYEEVDRDLYASVKLEGQNAALARTGTGYSITMVFKRYAKEISITWEMRNLNKDAEVVSEMHSLTDYIANRQDLDLSLRLTNAAATSYVDQDGLTVSTVCGDGLSLANAAHTLAFSATTYTNIVPGNPGFSQGAYELALDLTTTNIYNNFGQPIDMMFNRIFCTRNAATQRTIRQLLESMADITSVQSGIKNIYQNADKTMVVLPNFARDARGLDDSTKKRWWGMAACGQDRKGWNAFLGIWEPTHLVTPAPGNNGENVHNDNWTYGVRGAYNIVTLSGRGFIISMPSN